MANHHNHNQRPHHPLWGLVSSWQSIVALIVIVLLLIAMVAPQLAMHALGNVSITLGTALMPLAGPIAAILVALVGIRVIIGRGGRGNGRH